MTCAGCAAEIGPSLLSCPTCHTLVHAERLKALAAEATDAGQRGDAGAELIAWRNAIDLLPAGSAQYRTVRTRIERLTQERLGTGAAAATATAKEADGAPGGKAWSSGGALSGLGLLIWKFKTIALLILTKGKLLLLGLTKASTFFSMLAALGVYWAAFGWRFAAGLVISIYIHEMGHVAALNRFGIAATAPMFLPGLGAVIRSRMQLVNPHEEARVGLAGPIWGLGAALAAYFVYALTGWPIWAAIGHFGAWVNLFNLLPVWQLDGAHAFKALSRPERWLVTIAIALTFALTHEGLLVLIAALAAFHAFRDDAHPEGDRTIALQYAGLIVILSWLSTISGAPHLP
jgi:Zn-dependent protease